MSSLKSAYDLACERVIGSKYSPKKVYSEEEEEEEEEVMTPIEFVVDFKRPGSVKDDREYSPAFIDQNPSERLPESSLEQEEGKEEGKEVEKEGLEISVQEPESIHYDERIMEVHWNGNVLDYGGFARLNRNMIFGLSNRNVRVKVDADPYMVQVNKTTQEMLEKMGRVEISPDAPKVFGCTVPLNFNHTSKKILYTMIETSKGVHLDYAGKLNMAHEIWVPTQHGKEILEASGIHPEIRVMPLGVDPQRYVAANNKPMNFGMSLRGFKFLSVFRWSPRKGYDILLKAFMEEFSSEEDVSLLLVSRPVSVVEELGEKQIVDGFNTIKVSINKPESELPHIALYNKPISERDMPKMYSLGDAFVLISRGEGFGLPYCEAAAAGLPVIASNCSGHSDYLKEDNSFLVDPDDYVVADRLSSLGKLCRFYEGQIFPDFGRPAIEKTKEHMRFVFENYKEAQKKAKKLRSSIISNYTWDMAIDRIYNRLKEFSNN